MNIMAEWDFPACSVANATNRLQARAKSPSYCWVSNETAEVPFILEQAFQAARNGLTVVGWVSFDAAPAFDSALTVRPAAGFPVALFAAFAEPQPAPTTGRGSYELTRPWADALSDKGFAQAMCEVRDAIAAGRYYQLNLTTRLHAAAQGDPYALYRSLKALQPAGYCAYLETPEWAVASLSPELFFDWDGQTIVTQPMKGTATPTTALDRGAAGLQASAKDRAENVMIVDLLRNDLARIAEPGSVEVPSLFDVQCLPTLLQMTSTVRARTRPGTDLAAIFAALFPCGSVTGAPKVAALGDIARLEAQPRGLYCGAVGLIRPGGHATFNVAIRTPVWHKPTGTLTYGVGSGVTWYSDAMAERREWAQKAHFLHRASAPFQLLETVRLEQGACKRLSAHLQRLRTAAAHFGFPFDLPSIGACVHALADTHPEGLWRVRLLLDRHGVCTTTIHPHQDTTGPQRCRLAPTPIRAPAEYLRFKTTWRRHYDDFQPADSPWFDTLLYTEDQELSEFTRGNLVLEIDGVKWTPVAMGQLLPGVLRAEALAAETIREAVLPVQALQQAARVWLINSLRGWVEIKLEQAI
ncbi:MAG: chorismate-binding protein [Burkholderiaceae bacterium]